MIEQYLNAPLTREWLLANGWHVLQRQDRQPTDHFRRCIGLETVERDHFLVSPDDLCLDLSPDVDPDPRFWFCWATRASAQNSHPSVWLHLRHLETVRDMVLLYVGITGRKFGPKAYTRNELMPPVFELEKQDDAC